MFRLLAYCPPLLEMNAKKARIEIQSLANNVYLFGHINMRRVAKSYKYHLAVLASPTYICIYRQLLDFIWGSNRKTVTVLYSKQRQKKAHS